MTFTGQHYDVRGGQIIPARIWPEIYLGGSSAPALDVAARYADVYLTWGEPPGPLRKNWMRCGRAPRQPAGRCASGSGCT